MSVSPQVVGEYHRNSLATMADNDDDLQQEDSVDHGVALTIADVSKEEGNEGSAGIGETHVPNTGDVASNAAAPSTREVHQEDTKKSNESGEAPSLVKETKSLKSSDMASPVESAEPLETADAIIESEVAGNDAAIQSDNAPNIDAGTVPVEEEESESINDDVTNDVPKEVDGETQIPASPESHSISWNRSLMDDDEDEEEEEPSSKDENDKEDEPGDIAEKPAAAEEPPPSAQEVSKLSLEEETQEDETRQPPSKGAQILMNRISSWKKKTNLSLSRNAQTMLKSPVGQSWANRTPLFQRARGRKDETVEEANKDDDDASDSHSQSSDSSSLEEEGSSSESSITNTTSQEGKDQDGADEGSMSLSQTPKSSLEESSSVMTDEIPAERQKRVVDAALAMQEAATGIVDSVASGFRGRYATGTEPAPDTTPKRKGSTIGTIMESQTSLIMKSRAATHMQTILDSLESHQYVMLLGSGMLGVNLKQTYLKHNGVYMDYFLPGGAAESSGVVFVGDVLVKVGETDVRRGTIHDVPQTIANARRPVVLVFSTGMDMDMDRVNYIDVAVAMMHKIREEIEGRNIASMPLHTGSDEEAADTIENEKENGDENSAGERVPNTQPTELGDEVSNTNVPTQLDDTMNNDEDSPLDELMTDQTEAHSEALEEGEVDNDTRTQESAEQTTESSTTGEKDGVDGDIAGHQSTDTTAELSKENEDATESSPAQESSDQTAEPEECENVDATPDSPAQESTDQTTEPENGDATEGSPTKQSTDQATEPEECGNGDAKQEATDQPTETAEELPEVDIPLHSFLDSNVINPPMPPTLVKESLKVHISKRCNDKFSVSMLTHAAITDKNFRAALRNAFLTCALDGRRLPFLAAHFSSEEFYEAESSTEKNDDAAQQTLASKQLMLFLELVSYVDLYGVTPALRRRDIAKRIAYKFFLPSMKGNRLEPPMFDFHHIVPDSHLRQLEQALNNTEQVVAGDLFVHFQESLLDSLSGPTFVSYLVSNECSRMRAYLRNTAPFVNISVRDIFDAIVTEQTGDACFLTSKAHAQNHFLYMLMHLLCLTENEFGTENDDLRVGMSNNRVIGLASGIACSLFIKGELSVCISRTSDAIQANASTRLSNRGSHIFALFKAVNHLWETFVAPGGGALECFSSSSGTGEALNTVRELLRVSVSPPNNDMEKQDFYHHVAKSWTETSQLSDALDSLSEELMCDYALNAYPKYREHKFHEWMCTEVNKQRLIVTTGRKREAVTERAEGGGELPEIANGCIRRLLRRVDLPVGVSSHKPLRRAPKRSHSLEKDTATAGDRNDDSSVSRTGYSQHSSKMTNANAHYAIVFGTDDGLNVVGQIPNPTFAEDDIRRYVCQATATGGNDVEPDVLNEKLIPPTLESYAIVPPLRKKPFSQAVDNTRVSADGWEVSLIDIMIPCSEGSSEQGDNASIYGVSLVFQKSDKALIASTEKRVPIELVYKERSAESPNISNDNVEDHHKAPATPSTNKSDEEIVYDSCGNPIEVGAFASPISFFSPSKKSSPLSVFARSKISSLGESSRTLEASDVTLRIQVHEETPKFSKRLGEKPWVERVADYRSSTSKQGRVVVGIALVSDRNSVLAMRDTLSRFLFDYSRNKSSTDQKSQEATAIRCAPLVDLLGNFSHKDVEGATLKCILEPYLLYAASPWLDAPLIKQSEVYSSLAGQRLAQSLPPVPLALLYVTVLLEQKVVLSSSRRSLLFAAANAITELLQPLKWSHLLVPLVPAGLAQDLVGYPAPFILGIPSEDPGNMDLLNDLPDDVTLVDLDVGRVILAPKFTYDDALLRANEDETGTARALRSQVLYLAQALGVLFGARLHEESWCSDSPLTSLSRNQRVQPTRGATSSFAKLRKLCHSFLSELVLGAPSCCYWIEEKQPVETASIDDVSTEPECTVLFDEDRFFHVKNLRSEGRFQPLLVHDELRNSKETVNVVGQGSLKSGSDLALSLDDFDLILETFLRCQSMSTFISSIPREQMVYY